MKKVFYLFLVLPFLACNNGQTQGNSSSDSLACDSSDSSEDEVYIQPEFPEGIIPMYCLDDGTAIYVYTCEEDSLDFASKVSDFKTLYVDDKTCSIEYSATQSGTVGYGNLVFQDEYYGKMNGVRYKVNGLGNSSGASLAVSDQFLKNNKIVSISNTLGANRPSLPEDLVKMLEEKYGQKITDSQLGASIDGDKAKLYVAQFEPQETTCMAVRVLIDGGKTYIFEDPCEIYPGEGPSWHVDDEDGYRAPFINLAVRTNNGLKLFFTEIAPESTSYGIIYTDGDALKSEYVTGYYNYVDYFEE